MKHSSREKKCHMEKFASVNWEHPCSCIYQMSWCIQQIVISPSDNVSCHPVWHLVTCRHICIYLLSSLKPSPKVLQTSTIGPLHCIITLNYCHLFVSIPPKNSIHLERGDLQCSQSEVSIGCLFHLVKRLFTNLCIQPNKLWKMTSLPLYKC